MSIPALNWAIQQQAGSPAAKIVLLLIADRADEHHSCWPSQQRLADESEMSVRSVQRHIECLVSRGLLSVQRRDLPGRKRATNRYFLPVETSTRQSDAQMVSTRQSDDLDDNHDVFYMTPVSHEPSLEPTDRTQSTFDQFWSVYPRKIGKGQARRAFTTACKKADALDIVAGAVAYADEQQGQETRFIAHPATWLNGERWLDESRPDPTPPSNMQGHIALVQDLWENEVTSRPRLEGL